MKKAALPQDFFVHVAAASIAIAFCLLSGWLLFRMPELPSTAPALDVIYIERVVADAQPSPSQPLSIVPPTQPTQPTRSVPPDAATSPSSVPPRNERLPDVPMRPATTPATPPTTSRLYAADGQIVLPAGVAVDPMRKPDGDPPGGANDRGVKQMQALLERRNPIAPEEGSSFGGEWESDGTLSEVATKRLKTGLKRVIAKLPHRKQVQEVRARPPPPVRFNPALHERPSDLGSEATGDAYKAAPIAFEKAPGLQGEASRRVRKWVGELEASAAGCDRQRLKALVAPVLIHLADLQRAEYAAARGGDPIQIEQLLPRTADMAYDQARRAVWYADKQLSDCAK
ncbi:hypothetical protein [Lysobacter sp. Root690]|uniref:hypothetical protein n=1 Tax=Lysobacter sp. Root690 TaxID=1736588 RepID=UPI0006FEF1BF|nr:hypothetical protein [Lysobacter sp. Root690]KRB04437.1 hypothetical protein ASD86_19205 [Lysobacter sp. Root690]